MVTGLVLALGQKTDAISAEILKEVNGDIKLTSGLSIRFWDGALDHFDEEIHDLFVLHGLDNSAVDLAEHLVALLVLEGVVEARLGHCLHAFNEVGGLFHRGSRDFH